VFKRAIFLLVVPIFLHNIVKGQISKKSNHIFIWDVTLSMKGYNNSPNIYNEVVEVMVHTLTNIEADGSSIYIIPFQDKVLQTNVQIANEAGKQAAIDFVKNFNNEAVTYTNICVAWEKAIQLIDNRNKNFLYLFTDGEQSDLSSKNPAYGKNCLNKIIDQYCALVNNTQNAYTFYISLNTNLPTTLKQKFKTRCPEYLRLIEGVPPTGITGIQPTTNIQVINLLEGDVSFTQYFDINGNLPQKFRYDALIDAKNIALPSDISLKFNTATSRKIVNGKTDFTLNLQSNQIERLKKILPEESTVTVIYAKQNLQQLGINNEIIEFTPDRIMLKIRNKKEKTLKITILE